MSDHGDYKEPKAGDWMLVVARASGDVVACMRVDRIDDTDGADLAILSDGSAWGTETGQPLRRAWADHYLWPITESRRLHRRDGYALRGIGGSVRGGVRRPAHRQACAQEARVTPPFIIPHASAGRERQAADLLGKMFHLVALAAMGLGVEDVEPPEPPRPKLRAVKPPKEPA